MTRLEFTCSDEKAAALLQASRLFDEGVKPTEWISTKDEKPKDWKDTDGSLINYLVYMPKYGVDVGNYLETAGTWVCVGLPVEVTHWMPLPKPPKEGKKQ